MIRLGSYLGDYFLIDEIASGGMASICLAYDRRRHRFVALKTLFSQYANDPVFLKRLRREGDIYRTLRHPNIIELIDSNFEGATPYLILEYIHGETLAGLVGRNPNGCKLSTALRILEDVVGALLQAHAHGIIHRDLQPQNVLIDGAGVVKLFDFGIAYAEDDLVRTITGTIMGTIVYASPEQSEGKEVDERADLYSLGLVLYEILTGRRAVDGKDLAEVMEKKLKSQIAPPTTIRADLPPVLEAMTMRLLQKEPEKRPRSINALMEEIVDLRCSLIGADHERFFGTVDERLLYDAKKLAAVGRLDEALAKAQSYAEAAGEKGERSADLQFLMARIHRGRGDTVRAAEAFESLLGCRNARDEHLLHYATFLHEAGDLDGALAALESFTKAGPLGEPAVALRQVLNDEKAGTAGAPVPKASPAPAAGDELEPGIMEPWAEGGSPPPAAAGAPPPPPAADGSGAPPAAPDESHEGGGALGRWRGALRSWLSRAMNKDEN